MQTSYSLRSFTGHRGTVMSLDFNSINEDLLCSCDGDNEIRYWNVKQGTCTRTFQVEMIIVNFSFENLSGIWINFNSALN